MSVFDLTANDSKHQRKGTNPAMPAGSMQVNAWANDRTAAPSVAIAYQPPLAYQPHSRYGYTFGSSYTVSTPPTISFSLVSTTEFTAKSDRIVSKEIVSILQLIPRGRFDQSAKRWVFPLSVHDQLRVALSSSGQRCIVEPLPRIAITNMLLHHINKRDMQSAESSARIASSVNAESDEKFITAVEKGLPTRLFNALAQFQREGVEFVMRNNGRAIIADEMGLGKAQPCDSHVLTPTGWKQFSELSVGDRVVGSDGYPTDVTGVFPRGTRQTFRVCFSDGCSVEASDDHLWLVHSTEACLCNSEGSGTSRHVGRGGTRRVVTTEQLHKAKQQRWSDNELSLKCEGCGAWKWKIPLVKPVHFERPAAAETGCSVVDTESVSSVFRGKLGAVDPYILGVLLGAIAMRCTDQGTTSIIDMDLQSIEMSFICEDDMEYVMKGVLASFTDVKYSLRERTKVVSCEGHISEGIICHVESATMMEALRAVGVVLTDKCGSSSCVLGVPESCLRGTVALRLRVLQGVMDSCGQPQFTKHAHNSDFNCMHTKSQLLMTTVRELVLSLGGLVCKGPKTTSKDMLSIEIYLPPDICPFSMDRKVFSYNHNYNSFKKAKSDRFCRQIIDIYPCRSTEVLCISVAATDHLYVCEHYAVTHNTIQAIATCAMYQQEWPVLVIAPPSARHHWQGELRTWLCPEICTPDDIFLAESASHCQDASFADYKYVIVSYVVVTKLAEQLKAANFRVVVVDESHYLKNPRAKRTQSIVPLLLEASRVIMLSGTPALSRPYELFTQLHALSPKSWSDEAEFVKRYCSSNGKSRGRFGPDNRGASNTVELNAILFNTLMIRRLKKNILTQLPSKKRHIVRIEIKDVQRAERMRELLSQISQSDSKRDDKGYALATAKATASTPTPLDSQDVPSVIGTNLDSTPANPALITAGDGITNDGAIAVASGQESVTETESATAIDGVKKRQNLLMDLFNESGVAKVESVIEHLQVFIDNPVSGKVIVFAHHRAVMDRLCGFLTDNKQDFIRIDGSVASKERFDQVDRFQRSSTCRVAVLAITAAGVAITLTAASTVFFAELFWTPGSMLQAEDRAHRIGQTSTVRVYYFLARGSVDDVIWPLVQKKMKTLGEVVEGIKNHDMALGHFGIDSDLGESSLTATIEALLEELGDKEQPVSMDNEESSDGEEEGTGQVARALGGTGGEEDGVMGVLPREGECGVDEGDEYDGLALAMQVFTRARSLPGTEGASCAAPVDLLDEPSHLPALPILSIAGKKPAASEVTSIVPQVTLDAHRAESSSRPPRSVIDLCDSGDKDEEVETSLCGKSRRMSESRREARKKRRLLNVSASSTQSNPSQPHSVVDVEFIDHADMNHISTHSYVEETTPSAAVVASTGDPGDRVCCMERGDDGDGFSIGEALLACFLPSGNDSATEAVHPIAETCPEDGAISSEDEISV